MMPGMIKDAFQPDQNSVASNSGENAFAKIKKLKELFDIGAITQEEFDTKKKEWLSQM